MVSEFVLGQTQMTSQDHFLQASKTYTKSSIVNLIRHSSRDSTEQTIFSIQKNKINTLNKSWILQQSLPLKNYSNQNVWCNSSTPQEIINSKFFHSLLFWRNNNHDCATTHRTPFSLEQLSTIFIAWVTHLL